MKLRPDEAFRFGLVVAEAICVERRFRLADPAATREARAIVERIRRTRRLSRRDVLEEVTRLYRVVDDDTRIELARLIAAWE
jgi:hypothetical protein